MRTKREIENELLSIKKQLNTLSEAKASEKSSMESQSKDAMTDTSSQMFALLKYMIDENKKTTLVLRQMLDKINSLEAELNEPLTEDEVIEEKRPEAAEKGMKQLAVSSIDAKIIQFIQLSEHSMACAEDIRKGMGYKGKNAACARLNKLYKMGLIERFQLGHKVYYKYDAGKATNLLIISPPQ
jgi:Zn-dependent metalloprotease